MKLYKVFATVTVPVNGHIYVSADSQEDAVKRAMELTGDKDETEWSSRLWQDGDWKHISWESAEDLVITSVEEADKHA
jgi:hypothetical protein